MFIGSDNGKFFVIFLLFFEKVIMVSLFNGFFTAVALLATWFIYFYFLKGKLSC